jgi:hypothetical protein
MAKVRILGRKYSEFPYGAGNGGGPGNIIFKGVIRQPSDFPTLAVVQIGWEYTIGYKERIISLTNAASVATATVSGTFYNNFINGSNIIVEGYTGAEGAYNGTFVGTKGAPNIITYPIVGFPPSPATGIGTIAAPDTVTDNDVTKTNTGQIFQNNDEIRWNGTAWNLIGADRIWKVDGKKILQNNPDLNVELDGNVVMKQDGSTYDDFTSGGSAGGQNGRITASDASDNPRARLNADGSSSIFKDGIDLQNSKIKNLFDEIQVYYVAKNGLDSQDGKTNVDAFLTWNKSFTDIAAIPPPSSANQFGVVSFDAGIYTGGFNMGVLQYTNVFAPNATVKVNDASINSNCNVILNVLQRNSGIGDVLIKTGTGKATFKSHKLINTISSGNLFIDNGILEATIDELTAPTRTDTIISANPANPNKVLRLNASIMRGKIFTTSISDVWKINSKFWDGDVNANASSSIYLRLDEWTGNIAGAGALANIYIDVQKRNSNPANDVYDATANIVINEAKSPQIHAYLSANQSAGASAITPIIFDTLEGTPYQLTLNAITGEITIYTNGIYEIETGYALSLSAVGQTREIMIYVNGTLKTKDTERQQSTAQDKQNANVVSKLPLKKGDLVKIQAYSDAAPAATISGGAAYKDQTYFKVIKVAN